MDSLGVCGCDVTMTRVHGGPRLPHVLMNIPNGLTFCHHPVTESILIKILQCDDVILLEADRHRGMHCDVINSRK